MRSSVDSGALFKVTNLKVNPFTPAELTVGVFIRYLKRSRYEFGKEVLT
jgi:hypothetical protein